MRLTSLLCLMALSTLAGCAHDAAVPPTPSAPLRVATYNTSLYSDQAGGLIAELEGDSAHARKIAAVLQVVRPDLVLLNEFDYDPAQRAADLFQHRFLEVAQPGGGAPLRYPYRYLAEVNTGVPSGLGPGQRWPGRWTGTRGRQRCLGYGLHPGQYGMLVLSKYPIDADAVRSFRLLKWSQVPGAANPIDPRNGKPWYSAVAWPQLRLSSKSHWDVPVRTPGGVVHFLVSHPTPPVFDGPEDRNGARNAQEIALWRHYLDNAPGAAWLCDDAGRCGGLEADTRFVIAGDLNNDPVDGDGHHESIVELLEHTRVLRHPTPTSAGGEATARAYAAKGIAHRGARPRSPATSAPRPARCGWTTCCRR